MTPEEEARWWRVRGREELRQVLFWRWDPLGVQDDLPYTSDKYDGYTLRVWSALRAEADGSAIAGLLKKIEDEEITVTRVSSERRAAVATLIRRWYDQSREYWTEFDLPSRE